MWLLLDRYKKRIVLPNQFGRLAFFSLKFILERNKVYFQPDGDTLRLLLKTYI